MTTLYWIIFATFIISLISFIGALVLFLKEKIQDRDLLFQNMESGNFAPFSFFWSA